ncbi:NlpC/P60 family protein [Streptomyces sp. NPDC047315]|uniref:C40 family peptidase n=1 Tax=Streptomyces sp. NPDC047315 TaxID=3155142 RepID=UPI0034022A62
MAAHRKPRQQRRYPFAARPAARTATTLALAGAATATAFNGTGAADTAPTPAQIKARVDKLYQEAEAATEDYNGVKEQADRARRELDRLRDEAARRTDRLNSTRNALGSIATAQYRAGTMDSGLRIALTSDPDEYLERAALAQRVGDRQAAAVAQVRQQLVGIDRLKETADHQSAELKARQKELADHKSSVQRKLAAAESLLAQLTAEQRAAYDAPRDAPATAAPARPAATGATGQRAARAVAYAYGALGKPYVWGATGPASYDCSGLTQAAWRAAGISLPRTTYTQINAGKRVARSELAPGDLVFFYPGISHVGLYVGGGRMVHAPRPGAPVRIASIDEMPFAGAARPA